VPPCDIQQTGARCWWLITVIVIAAFLIRVVYDIETQCVPLLRHFVGDAAGYWHWAQEIAAGKLLGHESFYQAPLYPYVLAACFTLAWESVTVVRMLQAACGAAAVWCLWYGTTRVFGRRVGMTACIMLAVYAPAIFFDGIVQKTSLGCLLVCGLLAAMAWVAREGRACAAMAVGVVSGLLVLTRENAIVWTPIVAIWLWLLGEVGGKHRRWMRLGAYIVGLAFVLGPVAVRNRVVGGEWSMSTFQAGPNFYIGNHQGADGRYQPLTRGHETPAFEQKDATALAEREMGRKLTAQEVSHYWMSRAMRDILTDPTWWLELMGRKMLMVWNRYEVSDVESLHVYRDESVTLRALGTVWHFGILCPLAAVGICCTWRNWRRLWVYYALIASMALAVAFFYVMARYRFPLAPLLIPFAAVGCVDIWGHLRSLTFRPLLSRALVALIVAAIVNWPIHDEKRLNAMAWMNVGVALAQEGDLDEATGYFKRAVEGHPESAEANNNLAQALALQGDFAGAIPHYKAALAAEPTLMGVSYNLGVALERVGRADEALRHYERAVELDPSDVEARRAVERLRGLGD